MSVQKILVATDGSESAGRAVTFAAELARATGAAVVAVHVFEPLALLGEVAPPVDFAASEARARTELHETWCAPLIAADVTFTAEVIEGAPAAAIVSLARDHNVDLIVVGARGHSRLGELLLGSTSSGVLHHAPVPVTVVPSP